MASGWEVPLGARSADRIAFVIETVTAVDSLFGTQYTEFQGRWQGILGLWTLLFGELQAYCDHKGIPIPRVERDSATAFSVDQAADPESQRRYPTATLSHALGCSFTQPSSNPDVQLPGAAPFS